MRVSHAPRRGFTLAELLVAITVGGVVIGALVTVLNRQQRFYAGAAHLIGTRGQLRQATAILPNDLRGISSVAGDLLVMRDSAIEFRATIGSAVACAVGTATIDLPPLDLAASTLTAWSSRPRPGDVAHVLDDVTGAFRSYVVVRVDSAPGWCPGPPFTTAADVGKHRYRLTLASVLVPGIVRGSPVRLTRRVRYTLYRSPSDREWYLGYADLDPSTMALNPVQPVSGPYRPYAAGATSGLTFRYLDAGGDPVPAAHPERVVRIDVVAHGTTRAALRVDGMRTDPDGRRSESDSVSIALRNRW